MWARVIEVMLALWLVMSPFVFAHGAEDTFLWYNDLGAAAGVALASLLSCWPPLQKVHLANLVIGAWLVGVGIFAASEPVSPAYENHVVVGFVLLMTAILPNHATLPPRPWRREIEQRRTTT